MVNICHRKYGPVSRRKASEAYTELASDSPISWTSVPRILSSCLSENLAWTLCAFGKCSSSHSYSRTKACSTACYLWYVIL